ncbi:MAG: sulfite exporter TauE/SafE family protein [Candidatus Limnocylindrales bacterium]
MSDTTSTEQPAIDPVAAGRASDEGPAMPHETGKPAQLPGIWEKEPQWVRAIRYRIDIGPRQFAATVVASIITIVALMVTLTLTPGDVNGLIVGSWLVGLAAGIALTSVGVYGGVLVPGLLLMGVSPLFAAPLSLFLQVLIVPFGASAHVRLGNVSRPIVIPLVAGGVIGAVLGPVVASVFDAQLIAVVVEILIIIGAALLLVSLPLKQMQVSRDLDDVPRARVAGIGTISGMFSGISGAGWGPMGVTLLILSRIEPRIAVGSSVFGRIFMAAAAVLSAFVLLTTGSGQFANVVPEWELVPVILTASLATMLPGALLTSRLGRTRMSVLIATVSISLAALALARTLFF